MKKKVFNQDLYRKASINDLILFCINSLNSKKDKCTFEKLIKECYTFFPQVFGLQSLKKWPDSRKLDRPLRTLRKRKLIKGNPRVLFSLTSLGKKKAEEISKTFGQRKLL